MKNELYLRFLVVLKHSVGVEGGSIVHLLYIWTRLLTLRWGEIKSPESCDINTSLNILSSARFISSVLTVTCTDQKQLQRLVFKHWRW